MTTTGDIPFALSFELCGMLISLRSSAYGASRSSAYGASR